MACAGDIYLGIDIGTSSVKVVFLGSSPLVSGASRELDIDTCGGTRGCCEQNPGVWIEALHEAISKALESNPGIGKRVKAIGVSGQQHGMVTLGEDGEIIRNCMLWCDTQAIEESKLLSEMAAYHIPAGFTGPKIMWLKKHEPLNFCKTARILLPHDYINFYLSGGKTIDCMEAGDASGCGFFDSELRAFDIKLMEYIDSRLASMLPKCALVDANSAIGMLDSTVAAALGLGSSGDNIIIAPGSGDNAMSALASGANKPGSSLVLSLGTSGTLAACSRVPVLDPSGVVAPFCDATGNWLPLVCIQNCTQAPEEIRQSRGLSVDQICLMAENEPAGSLGVVILPFFNGGERTPDIPVAAGTIHGLRTGYLSRSGLLYRAALEGVTFGLYRFFILVHLRNYYHISFFTFPLFCVLEL